MAVQLGSMCVNAVEISEKKRERNDQETTSGDLKQKILMDLSETCQY